MSKRYRGQQHGELEPVPGLPEELPDGERILWQGSPRWRSLARRVFKVRLVAIYFAALLAVRVGVAVTQGESGAVAGISMMVVLFAAGLGLLALFGWLHTRATIYTITNRRIVMRIGVAFSTTWNLPFRRLASADLALHGHEDGDLVLALAPPDRVGWLHFWPHLQPRRVAQPRPALRCLGAPEKVAEVLRDAVADWAQQERAMVVDGENVPEPEGPRVEPAGRPMLATRSAGGA